MSKTKELKLCPFCGNQEKLEVSYLNYWSVWCGGCEAEGPIADDEMEAIEKWNQRK